MRALNILALLTILLSTAVPSDAAELRLARFSADVTIPVGHRCMGVLPVKAKKIVDPLEAHGLVFLGAGKPIVLVVVDWCEIRNDAYDRWRTVLAEAAQTVTHRVLISSVHQHDAPVVDLGAEALLASVGLGGELCDTEFHEKVVQRVAEALRRSLNGAVPITHLGVGKAHAKQLASNRRVLRSGGRVAFDRGSASGGDPRLRNAPEGQIDPWVRTLSFWNGSKPIAALHSYATHPMSYYGRGGVSADFVGSARRRLQKDTPDTLQIYASGASGDVTVGKYNDGAPENRPRLAERLYEAMAAAWKGTKRHPLSAIGFRSTPFHLPFNDGGAFTRKAMRSVLENSKAKTTDRILAAMGLASRDRIDQGRAIDLTCIDFGVAQLALLPGESFVGYQLLAQQLRPDKFIVCLGYGECWPGYVPTRAAFDDGFGHSWRWVARGAEERLGEALRAVLHDATTAARAAHDFSAAAALARKILPDDRPLREVQMFCESRVAMLEPMHDPNDWGKYAESLRQDILQNVVLRGAAADWRKATRRVVWLDTIAGADGYHIRKLRFEAVPGLWIPALLYEPKKLAGKVPVVLNVNGHDGKGKAAVYKQLRCIEQAKRGALALNVEWLGMGQLRDAGFGHYKMNQLDLCGTSGLAPFYLAMERALDVLLSHEHADASRVAVAGLSGGGWQTILISALDTRVTLANPVAGYGSYLERLQYFSDLGDSEQTPVDLAARADYTHLTALLAPRPALLTYNAKDNCCFRAAHTLPRLVDAAKPIYELYARPDLLRTHVNDEPGDHNFGRENRGAFYAMLTEHFGLAGGAKESATEAEVKTAEELHVALPEPNADFNKLALELSRNLRAKTEDWATTIDLQPSPREVLAGLEKRRALLNQTVRARSYAVRGTRLASEGFTGGERVTWWSLRVGEDWTIPAVEIARDAPSSTVLVVGDGGRGKAAASVEGHLRAGRRVIVTDPLYLGESRISARPFLFALLVSSVGERTLGIQASQVAAVARWIQGKFGNKTRVEARGPRSSLLCLIATAIEVEAIESLTLHGSYGSLHEVIEANLGANQAPELFCFGLLEHFDIRGLAALTTRRKLVFRAASDRVRKELAGLDRLYEKLGGALVID